MQEGTSRGAIRMMHGALEAYVLLWTMEKRGGRVLFVWDFKRGKNGNSQGAEKI